ncbi:ABC transporter substrate-binding protein [Paenibacillus sp. 1P07SE]|uniref:ABC transporter substrate-binding protein n=1 Tax=Paenibacillus sp. 1P07SE TaxID=3132209 RepID=UPI0039A4B2B8
MAQRRLAVAGALLAGIVAVAGCSSGSGGDETGNNAQRPPSSSKSNEEINLRFTYWGSTYEKDVINKAIGKFTEDTGIKVEGIIIPSEYETKLTTMIASNDAPDVGYLGPPTAYKWYEDGKLANIKELIETDSQTSEEDYIDGVMVKKGDDIVGLMNNLESFALFYNKDAFEEAGIEAPPVKPEDAWTWEEFIEVAKQLTVDDKGRNALDPEFDAKNIRQYGFNMNLWSGTLEALLIRNGTQYYPDMGDETGINTPAFNQVFQNVADLINVHQVMPSPTTAKSMPAPAVALQSKRYAMVLDGQWVTNDFANSKDLNYGIAVLPKMTSTTAVYSGALGVIFAESKHPKEAWLLLQYITNPESAIELFRDGLWMPNLKEYYTDESKIDVWASVNPARVEGYKDVLVDPIVEDSQVTSEVYVKNFGEINNILFPALDQAWTGKKSVDDVMAEVMPKITPLLEGSIQ